MRQRESSRTYGKTIALEILKSNLNKCKEGAYLNNWQRIRQVIRINKQFIPDIIPLGTRTHIPIKHFIDFLKVVPKEFWCETPVFYYNVDRICWDALGFLGEKIHKSTIRTKYLQLCFAKVGLEISDVLNNEESMFLHYDNNKDRFISALKYLEKNLEEEDLKQILIKAKKLSDERHIIIE